MSTGNLSVAVAGFFALPFHFQSITADTVAAARIKLPCAAKLLSVSVAARAKSGTNPTLTATVKDDGTSVQTAAVSVADGAVTEASLDSTKQKIADESIITIDLDIGGTDTPTFLDVDVLLNFVRI